MAKIVEADEEGGDGRVAGGEQANSGANVEEVGIA
jgi:hypothetical protein